MSRPTQAKTRTGEHAPSLAGEWLVLIRPRIATLVVLAAFVGGLLAAGPAADLGRVLEAALWIGCVAASSSVFNQVLERETDAYMERTRTRPLVTGTLRVRDAIFFGAFLSAVGTIGLAQRFSMIAALLGLGTIFAYALVYTPLKRVSTLNTAVGALPGAMPPLLGYAAISGEVHSWAWYLFAVLFAWQFPHFMAIAWLYRKDYARAGMKMLPALPDSEGLAGRQAVVYGLFLVPVSLLPVLRGEAGTLFVVGALVLGLAYLAASVAFALREDERRARVLLVTSLIYLPVLFAVILIDPVVRAAQLGQ